MDTRALGTNEKDRIGRDDSATPRQCEKRTNLLLYFVAGFKPFIGRAPRGAILKRLLQLTTVIHS